ncbi:MAG: hypothetical protein HYY01_04585 [Chloroflexi bacterium]|nr:hypothetical protein [Chloroflexota bacterium]
MAELFDLYVDQFYSSIGVYGATITFLRTPSKPSPPGSAPQSTEVAVIRMSGEHLKTMVYMLKKQIEGAEEQLGVSFPASYRVLNELKIAPEDWEKFWRKE